VDEVVTAGAQVPAATQAPTLAVGNVSKTFNGVRVLRAVDLTLYQGEVVAMIGQNGSGKSTLIKVLSGFHPPDHGARVLMGGRDIGSVLGAGPARTGMAFIHQDLALVPSMTILENLRIARFSTGVGGRIRWRQERAAVREALAVVGLDVSPDLPISRLPLTERALVAIARGLSAISEGDPEFGGHPDARLLVLDEPTAYLPDQGVERLFDVLRMLARSGTSILFVSHRLDEVLENCHRVVVLRGGDLVADVPTAGHGERDLIELMLGQPPEQLYPEAVAARAETGLEVRGLAGGQVREVSFAAQRGEIVGLVGLPGGGYDEIPYLLAGAQPATGGVVTVGTASVPAAELSPRRALEQGIALLPADRSHSGGALRLSVRENMTLPTLSRFSAFRTVIRRRREGRAVAREVERFAVRPEDPDLPIGALSGGNQQKVLLAKWVMADPSVLALHEPTQGVDVGAKREVFGHLAQRAAEGTVVVISSVEFEDLASLCRRVHVVAGGRIRRTIEGEELTPHELAAAVHAGRASP
jgi:ribose transport system ATP-binding protein